MKIKKILIANRSEIACRIIRTCKEMGITSVAVYSDADKDALHVRLADESCYLGASSASESYLNLDKIIDAAIGIGADAIHPGYGFLSENYEFNTKVRDSGLIFIGPNPEAMRILGSKVESRVLMIDNNIPVVPGMKSSSNDINEFIKTADAIGYPVLIKASAGGGGKGMRVVNSPQDLLEALESAMRESQSAFGSSEVFLEKFIEEPRHIEVQVAADNYGTILHLFERECSIQRRHQKVIEESPSLSLTPELRQQICQTAIRVAEVANYDNLGTCEFIFDKSGNYYFLEVNARIQVEHPVTEMVTGQDLVKMQIMIASGEPIELSQDEINQNGHAIECRIYAEDGDNQFMPASGKILMLNEPKGPGIRFDTGVYEGYEVPVFYDPIMAKLIAWGSNREQARRRIILALKELAILGVKNSIGFLIKCLEHEEFIAGNTFTNFIEINELTNKVNDIQELKLALALAPLSQNKDNSPSTGSLGNLVYNSNPWNEIGSWEIFENFRI